jgi:cyclopropane fatty-acyl-phospholipid synthase-like methyltransferase
MKATIITEHPIAYTSLDHTEPKGTKQDNTRNRLFIRAMKRKIGENINYADWGCAGGAHVRDALESGMFAVGIEGSDYCLVNQRAEWAVIPDNLFTADLTKPFHFKDEEDNTIKFDAISCYDVLEHISEEDLHALISNLNTNIKTGGYVICGISAEEDPGYHVSHAFTEEWWNTLFSSYNYELVDLLQPSEFGRYAIGHNLVYKKL